MQGARGDAGGGFTRFASVRGKQGVAAREFLELQHLLVRQAIVLLLDLLRERVWAGPRRLRRARGSNFAASFARLIDEFPTPRHDRGVFEGP